MTCLNDGGNVRYVAITGFVQSYHHYEWDGKRFRYDPLLKYGGLVKIVK